MDEETGKVLPFPGQGLAFPGPASAMAFTLDGALHGLSSENLLRLDVGSVKATGLGPLGNSDLRALTAGPGAGTLLAIQGDGDSSLVSIELKTLEISPVAPGHGFEDIALDVSGDAVLGVSSGSVYRFRWEDGDDQVDYLGTTAAHRIALDRRSGMLLGIATVSGERNLTMFDPRTGSESIIGPLGFSSVLDIMVDPRSSEIYGLLGGFAPLGYTLLGIDPVNGHGTILGSWGTPAWNLAWDSHRHVFYLGSLNSCCLFEMDPRTEAIELIGSTGFPGIWSLSYDARERALFGVTILDNELVRIDPETAEALAVGVIDTPESVRAIAFDSLGEELYGLAGDTLLTISRDSGVVEDRLELKSDLVGFVGDLAADPGGRLAYATVAAPGAGTWLDSIDLESGEVTCLGATGLTIEGIAFDDSGQCYGGNELGLARVELATGRANRPGQDWLNVRSLSGTCGEGLVYGHNGIALLALDPEDGRVLRATRVYVEGRPSAFDSSLTCLTYDCRTGLAYGTTSLGLLVSIDPQTGQATTLASGVMLGALSMDPSGRMFGVPASSGLLVEIDTGGVLRTVGPTGHDQIDDLEFLPDGRLLAVDSMRRELLEVDITTGMATTIRSTSYALNSIGALSL